ncbi:hypothetical protein JIG36_02250 [Actinoplanes sp. LDG1-06]|uniref:Uncharacterized protein n=1 Tax=Paractinoplanes ovalisporus TaxID=2810368 RepID=A0ABS2A508_9ACTN|nr:DUF5677 domain-containing protein [Actinoplanes ovalisporus]MBM2614378.1 hypothetical protein [Actinoplanes ovalisporus]
MTGERGGFDEWTYARLADFMQKARDAGRSEEEVTGLASGILTEAIDKVAPAIVQRLVSSKRQMIASHNRVNARFERLLRVHWAPGLDSLYSVIVASEEHSGEFYRRHRSTNAISIDLFDALAGLQARACRVAFEIHALLSRGFALGALARCRTLYELAVTSIVLGEFGKPDRCSDLASRFLEHEAIANLKDARDFQNHAASLGERPFTVAEMARAQRRYDRVIEKYGREFREPYGWAVPLFAAKPNPKFSDLEQLAEFAFYRPFYKRSSHEVHSGSKGFKMNITEGKRGKRLETGRSLEGLAEPGNLTAMLLTQCTSSYLVDSVNTASPESMLALKSIILLTDESSSRLNMGTSSLERVEVNRGLRNLRIDAWGSGRRRHIRRVYVHD